MRLKSAGFVGNTKNRRSLYLIPGGSWQSRREEWKSLGIRSEIGRDANLTFHPGGDKQIWKDKFNIGNVSIFDPTLCEQMGVDEEQVPQEGGGV